MVGVNAAAFAHGHGAAGAPAAYVSCEFGGGLPTPVTVLQQDAWRFFDLARFDSPSAPFAGYMTTDGVSCGVARRRGAGVALAALQSADAAPPETYTQEELACMLVVGVDPGAGRSWFTAASSPLYAPTEWAWRGCAHDTNSEGSSSEGASEGSDGDSEGGSSDGGNSEGSSLDSGSEGGSGARSCLLHLHDRQLNEDEGDGAAAALSPQPRRPVRAGTTARRRRRRGGKRRKQSKHWQPRGATAKRRRQRRGCYRMSMGHWRQMAGLGPVRAIDLQAPPELQRYIAVIPTAATASSARYEVHLRYLFGRPAAAADAGPSGAGPSGAGPSGAGPSGAGPSGAGPSDAGPPGPALGVVDVLWHYHTSAFRRKRWAAFIQRDRALHRVAQQLTRGRRQEEVVVGWGSWAFGGGQGGSPISTKGGRAPTGRLIKLLRERYAKHVLVIDEYRTSKTCYNCGHQDMVLRNGLAGLRDGQRAWSVKDCNSCFTTWNRDVSAANVIRILLLLKLLGFSRPAALERPPAVDPG